jgi:hypothetical protein
MNAFKALPKITGLVVLNFVLLASVFHWWGAELNNQTVSVALMVLLLSLFSELSEFDFWGLKGKREQKRIEAVLEGSKDRPAIDPNSKVPSPARQKTRDLEAAVVEPGYLLPANKENFLALCFEIERLLRIAASRVTSGAASPSMSPANVTKLLWEQQVLTDAGLEQLKAIRAVRDLLVHGREGEVNPQMLETVHELAGGLYSALYNLLYGIN